MGFEIKGFYAKSTCISAQTDSQIGGQVRLGTCKEIFGIEMIRKNFGKSVILKNNTNDKINAVLGMRVVCI